MSVKPADIRVALQRVAAAILASLDGTAEALVHEVTSRDWARTRRALVGQGLLKNSRTAVGGKGGSLPESTPSTAGQASSWTPASSGEPTSRSDVSTSPELSPRTTWLTPYYDAYRAVYGEPPNAVAVARMARTFKVLEVHVPRAAVVRRFVHYLRTTPARFYSVEHFADTCPAWESPSGGADPLDIRPGEDIDGYMRRLASQGAR